MTHQSRIDRLKSAIRQEQGQIRDREIILTRRFARLMKISLSLNDPHALIPNSVSSLEEWLTGHPFPDAVLSSIYANRELAFQASLYSHTTMYKYHIVPCKPKEYYQPQIPTPHDPKE